ncbi:MAG: ABC transporter ATP-binding protein [Candidatus Bipolaricaulota bacterium]|nr:ABC transporter ATP-binding protein [Candidatus Bipolaricaulota bacterium]
MLPSALELERVRKVFSRKQRSLARRVSHTSGRKDVVALESLNLTVDRREIFGVLGPNGSGKSTLIRLVSTLLLPDSGTIRVFGHDIEKEEFAVKRLINRVSVDAAFFKKFSPLENLTYAARLYGMPMSEARGKMREILLRLGLKEETFTEPMERMSRGMQQKVAVARGFLTSPSLLLLDEPTTGLDPYSKRDVQAFVREVRESHDATVVLTTHDMDEAERLCDRIAILDKGKVIALDTAEGLKNLVPKQDGNAPTLEDVFIALTGGRMEDKELEVAE